VRKHDTLSKRDVNAIRQHIAVLDNPPLISVLMPVYNVPVNLLRETIDSVLSQLYPHFELCIADDASPDAEVKAVLEEYARRDARIKVVYREKNGHISAASNTALAMAAGKFAALLDHDDLLPPHALYWVAVEVLQYPDTEVVYSDEDKINESGKRLDHYFKPDWNLQLALSQNFVSHLGVYRTETLRQIGGFREGYEGSQDYDLMLRVVARVRPEQIRHIPSVLYHWRVRPGSTALGHSEKDYAWDAGRRAIEDYLTSQGVKAAVTRSTTPVFYWVHYALPEPAPRVSVIIPTKDHGFLLRRCVESLLELTTYKNFEVIVVDNGSTESAATDYLEELRGRPDFRVLSFPGAFNYSAINNMAAATAEGEVLCLLNNDTEIITANWMEEMLGCLMQRDVGVVGARLLYSDDTVQHAGVILAGEGRIAMHAHAFIPRQERGYVGRASLAQDISAVTGACMMVRRRVFAELGGLDEKNLAVAFNDVDFCLRARQAGWRVVYTPYAELYHHESATRGGKNRNAESKALMQREAGYMRKRWGKVLKSDPYYNPNLSYERPDFSLSHTPMVSKPWED
jgi:GT2 family glycosyltransferase